MTKQKKIFLGIFVVSFSTAIVSAVYIKRSPLYVPETFIK